MSPGSTFLPILRNIRTAFSQSTQRMDSDSDDGGFSSFFRRRRPVSPLTLVAFYDGSGTDGRGRQLDEVLRWGASNLERHHDYIQTLFPLPEESGFAHAPIINKEVFEAFRSRPELRDRLRDSFEKMLWFYGFGMDKAEDGKITVSLSAHCDIPFYTLLMNADSSRSECRSWHLFLEFEIRPQSPPHHPNNPLSPCSRVGEGGSCVLRGYRCRRE
jgi:hypothetical protein